MLVCRRDDLCRWPLTRPLATLSQRARVFFFPSSAGERWGEDRTSRYTRRTAKKTGGDRIQPPTFRQFQNRYIASSSPQRSSSQLTG